MLLPALSPWEWILVIIAAACIGISKSGFAGLGLITVIVMAKVFPARESTGALLPLLICGDIGAVIAFRQHAQWPQIWKMLPPAIVGIVIGFGLMSVIPGRHFAPLIGWIVLTMTILQAIRSIWPQVYGRAPHTRAFAWFMGIWGGITTMLANAAGPVMALYFLAVNLPKYAFVGTAAWFFLIVNTLKIPFSTQLGLIRPSTLLFDLVLIPAVAGGILLGRKLIAIVPQKLFERLLIGFAGVAALRLIGLF